MKKIMVTVLALVCALTILQMVTPAMAMTDTDRENCTYLLDREKEWAAENGYSMWANGAVENGTIYACGMATDCDDVFYDAHCSDDVVRKSATYIERFEKVFDVHDTEIDIEVLAIVSGYELCRVIITFDGAIEEPVSGIVINEFDFLVMFYT